MKKLKTISSSLLVAAFVVGCSNKLDDTALDVQAVDNQLSASSADDESLPIFASFNNAYKTTVAENDPISRKDPRNSDKYFVKLINSAKKTLDGAFYDIQDPDVTQAFINAHKRGVKVRLVTDDENLKDKQDPTKDRQSIIDLKKAGIEVKDDKREKLMHNKFMVVDNTYVWTGSMNLTTSSMYHHNNNSIRIKSPELAQNFNAEFSRFWDQNLYGTNPHTIPNQVVNVAGSSIRTFFSPGGGTNLAIVEELKKAKKSIKFMAFSMTHKDILAVMTEKKQAGLNVEGIFDECLIPQYSIYFALKKANIFTRGDGNQALMHHKVMIIDDETVITGSFNFSKSADEGNNENCLFIKSPTLAKIYNSEYSRIKYAALNNKNIPPYDHPACSKHDSKGSQPAPAKNSAVVETEKALWDKFTKE
ncbi:MAG: phospholipase D-like domain-containing protein [Candidatus Sericytochromatia bacterium]